MSESSPEDTHTAQGTEHLHVEPAHRLVTRLSPGNLRNLRWWHGLQQTGEHPVPVLPLQLVSPGKHLQKIFLVPWLKPSPACPVLKCEYTVYVNWRFVPHILLKDCMSCLFFFF